MGTSVMELLNTQCLQAQHAVTPRVVSFKPHFKGMMLPAVAYILDGGFKYFLFSSLFGIQFWLIFFKRVETTN